MKTMSCIIALTCCIQVAAQSGKGFFNRMDEQERNEYLVAKAKEVVLNFGPEYYREYGEPEISVERLQDLYEGETLLNRERIAGGKYYIVTFRYNTTEESLEWDYAAQVKIGEKDGEPWVCYFGNGCGLHFFDKPYRERVRQGLRNKDVVRYQPARERVVVMDERR